jgi:alcohol dehydrogenase class IV
LNAILLPAVLERNASEKYADLALAVGSGSARTMGIRYLKNGLIRLRRELGMPATLTEAGIDPQKLRLRLPELVKTTPIAASSAAKKR